ncbi:GntR family transcriptional regulator [Brevibacillus marinus]|uniref:GntR family transcriptional regulator n=1 Tax=Brevibacillus marinus TaxID=2496837 RepID=UPI0013DFA1AF|nr:GntR family transcriptional regulator [Brevibacillus marinus]
MKRTYLKDIAYQKIKEKILEGHYLDKNYTSENELVEELQMSRTPIREALQRLQYEGLVKIFSNQGIVFQELSIKETSDLFDLRLAIETFAIRKVVRAFSESDLQILETCLDEQRVAYEREDPRAFMRHDAEFHQHLLRIADNEMFMQIMSNIRDRLFYQGCRIFKKNPNRILHSLEEHIEIISAIKSGDPEAAVSSMEKHLLRGKQTLMS